MFRKRFFHYLRLAAIFSTAAFSLAASEHHGVVKFGGLPLPGATVTASQGDKKFVAVTDQQGVYAFPDLPDGLWTLQVEMLCFAPLKQEVAIAPGSPSPEWTMTSLPFDEIKASAPPPPPPPVTSAAQPTNTSPAPNGAPPPATPEKGKNAKNTAKNAKNAKGNAPATATPQSGFQRTEVNASPDAAPVNQMAASGESQSASDSLIVNGSVSNGVERRTIGNARKGPGMGYRGDFGTVVDNSWLNARQYSLTGQNTPQPAYNHLRFTASFGGPLRIPHLLRPGGQFFLNYGISRNRNANTATTLMPTDAERTGDFSQVSRFGQPVVIYDPKNGLPFADNLIPSNRISEEAKALLKFYPRPNFIQTAAYNYQTALVGRSNQDDVQSRVNRSITRKDFLNGNFAYRNSRGTNPSVFSFVDSNNSSGMNAAINWRHMFNQRLNLAVAYNFSRMTARNSPFFAFRQNVSGDAGISGNNQEPQNWGPPNLNFSSGVASLSDGQQSLTRNQTGSTSVTVQWSHRPHNFTFGADHRKLQFNNLAQQNARGSFGFTGALTQGTANGATIGGTGSDFADFLLGVADTASLAFGNADKYFRTTSYDAYFTDDWRMLPGFSLNAGVRWEYNSPITEKYGRLVNLDVIPGFSAVAPVVANNPIGPLTGRHYADSLMEPDKHAFQPRVSFAWHPLFGSSMVVRGGYGVYYNTSIYQTLATQMSQQSPLSKSLSVQNGPTNNLTLANGFNSPPANTPNTFAIDPRFRVGYSQNWQVSVQRDLFEGVVATATYLGIKGTRTMQIFLPNTYPNGVNPCPACPAGFAYTTSNGNSTREAGQLQIQRRFHAGISASIQYVYSKSLDDAVLGGRGQGSSVIAQDWLNLRGERGLSNFDQRHLVTFQAQYSSGVGVHGGALLRGWKGAAVKGWTVVTNISAGSGLPQTPIYPQAVRNTGVSNTIRPDYIGGSVYDGPPGYYLNPAAFAAPVGHWGTAGRNSIIGPSQFAMAASMARTFADNLDLRIDTTNTLNHVSYTAWNTTLGPQFGVPVAANAMRSVQLNLRWRF